MKKHHLHTLYACFVGGLLLAAPVHAKKTDDLPLALPFGITMGMKEAQVNSRLQQNCLHLDPQNSRAECLRGEKPYQVAAHYKDGKLAQLTLQASQSRNEFEDILLWSSKKYDLRVDAGKIIAVNNTTAIQADFHANPHYISGEALYRLFSKEHAQRLSLYMKRAQEALEDTDSLRKEVRVFTPELDANSTKYQFAKAIVLVALNSEKISVLPDMDELATHYASIVREAMEQEKLPLPKQLFLWFAMEPFPRNKAPLVEHVYVFAPDGSMKKSL